MRRIKPGFRWHVPNAGFCKYAGDPRPPGHQNHLVFVTDPRKALEYWTEHTHIALAAWIVSGDPVFVGGSNSDVVWILSPDPGKEINGDS